MEFIALIIIWMLCELYVKYVQYKINREERRKDEEAKKIMEIMERDRVRYTTPVVKYDIEYIPD